MINKNNKIIKIPFSEKVIIVFSFNDIQISQSDCKTFKELSKNGYPKIKMCDFVLKNKIDAYNDTILKKIDNIFESTRTWIFVKNRLANVAFLRKSYSRQNYIDLYLNQQSEQFITYINILKQFQADAKKNEIMIDFVYFPDVWYLNEKSQTHKAFKNFKKVAKTENIIINDAWKYLMENKDSVNMSYSLTDSHPNCKAHEIMANYIVEKIL